VDMSRIRTQCSDAERSVCPSQADVLLREEPAEEDEEEEEEEENGTGDEGEDNEEDDGGYSLRVYPSCQS